VQLPWWRPDTPPSEEAESIWWYGVVARKS
jgi:hypothetical protein